MDTLTETIKKKFARLTNQQLIDRANNAPDFKWDDEGYEINRRQQESNGQLIIIMDYSPFLNVLWL